MNFSFSQYSSRNNQIYLHCGLQACFLLKSSDRTINISRMHFFLYLSYIPPQLELQVLACQLMSKAQLYALVSLNLFSVDT